MSFSARNVVFIAFALSLALPSAAPAQSAAHAHEPLVFSVMGDGPRVDNQWVMVRKQLDDLSCEKRSDFILHVGDIVAGKDADLPESYYVRVAEMLRHSALPIFIVPGDNEWNDQNNPEMSWIFWERHFGRFEQYFPGAPETQHQPGRIENVAFLTKGVLIIGINLVGGRVHDPAEWKRRHQDNAEWVAENLGLHAEEVRAAVVFTQAHPGAKHDDFIVLFRRAVKEFGKPVLFIHGDGHKWQHEYAWDERNLLRVQIDMIAIAPPLEVTVTLDPKEMFTFDRRLPAPSIEKMPQNEPAPLTAASPAAF